MSRLHAEGHLVSRIGWLRAAVLGANDGIVSTASLIVGVAAAHAAAADVLVAGVAGLVAGAMSMAAGEYVSVSSQSDTERADLDRERAELATQPAFEREELAQVYIGRGVEPKLALQVADQLMAKDALGAHARDELGISEATTARPIQAALTSAAAFSIGAAMPLAMVLVSPTTMLVAIVVDRLALVSRGAWRHWGEGRRRQRADGNRSGHVLGCDGHGSYCRHRRLGRHRDLSGARQHFFASCRIPDHGENARHGNSGQNSIQATSADSAFRFRPVTIAWTRFSRCRKLASATPPICTRTSISSPWAARLCVHSTHCTPK